MHLHKIFYALDSSASIRKVISLWVEVFEYSVLVFLILVLTNNINFSFPNLIKVLLPISFNQYWFITSYFIIYIFSYYINKLLHNISKKNFKYFLFMLCVIEIFIPTFTGSILDANKLGLFLLFYCLGAFIKMYGEDYNLRKIGSWLVPTSFFLMILSVFSLNMLSSITKIDEFQMHATHFLSERSLLSLMLAVGVFLIFLTNDYWNNKTINYFARSSIAIYLIHDNNFFRPILWRNIFKVQSFKNSPWLALYGISTSLIIFVLCIAIDILRRELIRLIKNNKFLD